MDSKNNIKKAGVGRRNFLISLPLAAAALTLNSAFGFPVETEQGNGKLFIKSEFGEEWSVKNGIFQFSDTYLEKLKSGKMESLALKVQVSYDQQSWKPIETSITDKSFMKQLTEIAQKAR